MNKPRVRKIKNFPMNPRPWYCGNEMFGATGRTPLEAIQAYYRNVRTSQIYKRIHEELYGTMEDL